MDQLTACLFFCCFWFPAASVGTNEPTEQCWISTPQFYLRVQSIKMWNKEKMFLLYRSRKVKSFLLHRILFSAERAKTHICPRFTTRIHQRGSICIPGHRCPAEICRGECVDANTKPSCEVWLSFQGQNTRRIFSFF